MIDFGSVNPDRGVMVVQQRDTEVLIIKNNIL